MKTKTTLLTHAELNNAAGFNTDQLDLLIRDLAQLAPLDDKVARQAIRYVVDGGDEEVLLRVAALPDAAEAVPVQEAAGHSNWSRLRAAAKRRANLLTVRPAVAPAAWVRLGSVYDAIARTRKGRTAPPADYPGWLCMLLGEMRGCALEHNLQAWPVDKLLAVLDAGGAPRSLLAGLALDKDGVEALGSGSYGWYGQDAGIVRMFSGWAPYLAEQTDVVRAALQRPKADERNHAVDTLSSGEYDFTPVIDLLVDLATSSQKTVRERALAPLQSCGDACRPEIERVLGDGGAGSRNQAAALLFRLFGDGAAATLRVHREGESSARVRQTIDKLLAAPTAATTDDDAVALPPVELELDAPLPDAVEVALRQRFDRLYEGQVRQFEAETKRWESPDRPKWMSKPRKPEPMSAKVVHGIVRYATEGGKTRRVHATASVYLGDALEPPDVTLLHVVRLALALQHLRYSCNNNGDWLHWDTADLDAYRIRCQPTFGLRELAAALAAEGIPEAAVGRAYLEGSSDWHTFLDDWEGEAVWPFFAERPELLAQCLGPSPNRGADYSRYDYLWSERRRGAFRALAMFPSLPARFVPLLWDLALGEGKTDRPLAQAALRTVPDKTDKILVALGDGKQAVRAAAAAWLGEVGDAAAIEPLARAYRKEKQEIVKGAMLTALESLGADVGEFLDRTKLRAEADAGLARKLPAGMEWVALDTLPAVRWQDGEKVPPAVVRWWVVQAVKQKTPVPGPLLRRYLKMCRRDDAAALANFVLASWVGYDTRTLPREEAEQKAHADAKSQWAQWGKDKWWAEQYKNEEGLYAMLLAEYTGACIGSAVNQKGMLAIAAAAGDRESVKTAERYIRKWFGGRLAQCKALVEVLAWNDDPLAVQVLLSIANRFRTKAIRTAAEEHVQALAEREGWTVDQLADRTIPDGGFARPLDDDGRPLGDDASLVLDYGPRQFTVRLDDALNPVISRDDGKTVKSPPAAGKSDDPDKAKAARKAFSAAKKTVREVVEQQSERLYEALCTQRTWQFDEWRLYLAQHAVVGRLCARLVWSAEPPEAGDGAAVQFRPLDDGSLTDAHDEEVTVDDAWAVRLAHSANSSAAASEAWGRHFDDYDVAPLFAQFGRETYTLPEGQRRDKDVTAFRGHLLTTFQLRSKAIRLGYLRGEAEDGGCFYVYRKPFPSLKLAAVIEFTGSYVPEEDLPAALKELYFTRIVKDRDEGSWNPNKVALGKVPPVLLSECYNDVKQIAAAGTGFDPEWEKKSYF